MYHKFHHIVNIDSHDDPGFQKTMDEYFYGLKNELKNISISNVLTNVIHQLTLNKDRKY